MAFSRENIKYTLNGILFVALFTIAAIQISQVSFIKALAISPLIIGIVIGMFYANTLRSHIPKEWVPGILFSSKQLLRFAIILYGFRITFQQIAEVGVAGLAVSTIMLTTTFILGWWAGVKIFKLDRDTSILCASGSSVCGAAAVLATEPVLDAEPYKSAVAVGTVVLFGTIAMFTYPALYKAGVLNMDPAAYGIYVGGTVHEVAQVVAAGGAIGGVAADNAVIVKMTRVMMIAPMLIILGILVSKGRSKGEGRGGIQISIPWFAVWFIVVAGINSFLVHIESLKPLIAGINEFDTFLLTMAMTALGMETSVEKFKQAGMKPVMLALLMAIWLMVGGYFVTQWAVSFFGV
ncbi:MAG: YeiH family putative sulfate export transporter [Epsilonproteobacteria bacterium]|nr:YeiH family putative sulfate export transporter [Campylobacterota bacterium]NPA57177.1 YeiH family putative sulfate export transporter [Campylobacterota bacterium]